MNKLFAILLMLVSLSFTSFSKDIPSNYFVYNLSNNVETSTKLIVGKTYESFETQQDFNTSSNSSLEMCFLNNVFVSVNENTKFLINQSYSEYAIQSLPSVIKPSKISYTFSVMQGDIDIVNSNTNNTDNTIVVHTPRINIILNEGQFKIIADKETTVIAVYKGSAHILNLLEDRKYKLSENNCGIITRYVPLTTRHDDPYYITKSTISVKPIQQDDLDKLKVVFNKIVESLRSVVFVIIDNKVSGVKTN